MKFKTLLFFLLLPASFLFAQQIQRVDPPNWWIGMQYQQIQLLVYGQQVGDLRVEVNYPGVQLLSIAQMPNRNYLILELNIDEDAKPGKVPLQFYDRDKLVQNHDFPLLARDPVRSNIQGFNTTDAIYLITPDRFVNGNAANDNKEGLKEKNNRTLKGGRHGGDISGIRKSLDYIKDMGFTAVWLNPLLENDMEEYSYHGYSTTDFYKVDARFGSNEEYQALADEGRSKGLKLIMDMIVNHCGLNHWWMKDLPADDWINQWSEYTETNHRKTILQDPYVSEADKKVFTDGWFVPTMPDLNQRNPFMAKYLIQNSIWWVEYLGLSGIRMDTYPYPDMDFMTDWTRVLMKEYPNLNIVGEEWFEWPTIVSYWQKGKNNPNGYESELKSVMDFPVQMALSKALNNEETWKTGWIEVYEMLAHDFLYPDPSSLVVFPDNHDMSRIFSQVEEDLDLYKQALIFFLTIRGIPQLYYGTEVLMKNPGTTDHGIIRSDFPGGWSGDAVNAFTGKGLSETQKSTQAWLKKLLQWRKTATAIHDGQLKHFIPKDGVYLYSRFDESQKLLIILNKNTTDTTIALQRYAELLEGVSKGTDVLSGKVYPMQDQMVLPAKSALILELSK